MDSCSNQIQSSRLCIQSQETTGQSTDSTSTHSTKTQQKAGEKRIREGEKAIKEYEQHQIQQSHVGAGYDAHPGMGKLTKEELTPTTLVGRIPTMVADSGASSSCVHPPDKMIGLSE